jgi:radical SAM superfamily enzyme YgiQ (UPF0313 family)
MPVRDAADIVLINPRFEASYWGLERALPFFGKRTAMPVASLPLLAALTPAEHRVRIVDENVEPLDFDRLAHADIVGLTGMSVQRARMREILTELGRRGVFTVVGGPWVSVNETYFGPLARTIFVGEAEETWPRFLSDWRRGTPDPRYEQTARTDMTQVPVPRYELLDMKQYLFGSIQFSRGCPFQCEFCDIIVTFGRRPRLKSAAQILRELDALHARGMEIVFIVDDNLIGNKKAVLPLLESVRAWQESPRIPVHLRHGSLARSRRRRGADAPDGGGEHPQRLRRNRDAERGLADRNEEASEREERPNARRPRAQGPGSRPRSLVGNDSRLRSR